MINEEAILNPPFVNKNTPLQKVNDTFITERGINLYMKREDLNHPELSGNKWHKLKYNLLEAKKAGHTTLLTFGGAYSNHIYATASAGKLFGLKTIGIIRGEEHLPLNPTLSFATECGMEIHYVDRKTYRNKTDEKFIDELHKKFGSFYLIPEGGTNHLAVKGAGEIINSVKVKFDRIFCACGTGGTIAGLIAGLNGKARATGVSVLKGGGFLADSVKELLNSTGNAERDNWEILLDYHFGGYAKINKELVEFVKRFVEINDTPIEPIYTGKMLFAIYDLIKRDEIKENETVIALHTGGLQGLAGMESKMKETLA